MSVTLYAATVPSWLQILGSVARVVAKAESFCAETGLEPDAIIQARLTDDMLPFAYQVKSAAVHSLGAIEGLRTGGFGPDMTAPPQTFAALHAHLAETIAGLEAIDPAEVEGFMGKPMYFEARSMRINFTAQDFLMSFSQPNFYFHAATAYDIARAKGVAIGKRDFLGRMRISD